MEIHLKFQVEMLNLNNYQSNPNKLLSARVILGGSKWDWSQSSPSNYVLTYFGVAMASNVLPIGVTALNGYAIDLDNWNESEKAAMRVALNLWTQLMGMPTEEVTDVSEANLKFYITDTNAGYFGAQYGPHSGIRNGYLCSYVR